MSKMREDIGWACKGCGRTVGTKRARRCQAEQTQWADADAAAEDKGERNGRETLLGSEWV